MKLFISTLLFLGFTAQIAYCAPVTPAAPSPGYISFGGFNTTAVVVPPCVVTPHNNPLGFFVVNTRSGATAGRFTPWVKNGTNYRVTSGKTAKCGCVQAITSAANTSYQLAHSLTAITHDDAALTSGTFQGGAAAAYAHTYYSLVPSQFQDSFDFPSLSYAAVQLSNDPSNGLSMVCREQ